MSLLPTKILPETDPIGEVIGSKVKIEHNWYLLFTNLALQVLGNGTTGAGSVTAVPVKGSPAQFQAPYNGTIVVSGGTVSKLTLTRGGVTVTPGALQGQFSLSKNDVVTVVYAYGAGIGKANAIPPVAPTMTFFQG